MDASSHFSATAVCLEHRRETRSQSIHRPCPKPVRRACPEPIRRDGWTIPRQARFLKVLAATRSVTKAARVVRMSRESAHRLRQRDPNGLFAIMWALCVAPPLTARDLAAVDQRHRLAMALAAVPLADRPVMASETKSTA